MRECSCDNFEVKNKTNKRKERKCRLCPALPAMSETLTLFHFIFFFLFSFLPASLVSCADVVLKCSVSFCPVFDFIPVVSESVLWGLCNKLYFS